MWTAISIVGAVFAALFAGMLADALTAPADPEELE